MEISPVTNLNNNPEMPEHFPAISVTVALGENLRRHGQVIEVDAGGVYEVLSERGVSDAQIDASAVVVDKATALELGVGTGFTSGQFDQTGVRRELFSVASVKISPLSIRRGDIKVASRNLGHELVHVAERANETPEAAYRSDSKDVRSRLLIMFGGFITGLAVQFGDIQKAGELFDAQQYDQSFLEAVSVLPGAVTGYATGLFLAMRFVASERPAYRQQKTIHQQHPHLLQVHPRVGGE